MNPYLYFRPFRTALAFCCLVAFFPVLHASGVRGKVQDEKGAALPNATIFVRETGSGAVSNPQGEYEIRLEPGTYELSFQFLGYRTETRTVQVRSEWVPLDIQLALQPIELRMSGINLNGEDPAYTVMRKAIAKAGYHRQQVDRYEARIYIKGSGRIMDVPFFLRKEMKKSGLDSNMAFTLESVSQVSFQRPNTFKENVISIRSQGQDNSTSPMPYIQSSFYEPKVQEAISPLSPQAFATYRFKLESFFIDRGYGVNKIKVTPRSTGDNVFDGYLYIVEDAWSIYSLSLTTIQQGIQFQIEQVYSPMEEKVWLPLTQTFHVSGSIFGVRLEYNYLATASNYKVTLNPELKGAFEVLDEKAEDVTEPVQKQSPAAASPSDRLASGGEISRKELRKILSEYEKEERKASEAPEVDINRVVEIDSQAYKKDSTYWERIRPVPLSEQEVKGYRFQDSISVTMAADTSDAGDPADSTRFNPAMGLLLGQTFTFSGRHRLSYDPLLTRYNFNPVDGTSLNTNLKYDYLGEKRFGLVFNPRYAFIRQRFNAQGEVYFNPQHSYQRNARWTVKGGRYIAQFNPDDAISPWINTYQTLVKARNFMRIYEKDYLSGAFAYKQANDWGVRIAFEWANRLRLENQTTQTFYPPDGYVSYGTNTPDAVELVEPIPLRQTAGVLSLSFEISPWQRYQLRNGRKTPIPGSSPRFVLNYRKGMDRLLGSEVDYDFLEMEFEQDIAVGAAGQLDLRLHAGWFPNNARMGFADFKHFPGNQIRVTGADPVASYRMLPYYAFSTREAYVGTFAHYQFRKFLLTRFPAVWMLGIKENLFFNTLVTPQTNYLELGYGVDNLLRFFRVEAVASFESGVFKGPRLMLGVSSSLDNLGDLFE
ncbi:MAG: hypothetical protein RL181_1228 [Bacteroidota bacterium]